MREDHSKAIINGMVRYMRLLGAAPNMELHAGDVEWITPKAACKGPSMVYKIELDIQSASSRLDRMAEEIRSEHMPSVWLIPPDSTPTDLIRMLQARGFRDISDPLRPEVGMALALTPAHLWPEAPAQVSVRPVEDFSQFIMWIDIVNKALHGWPMIDAENYRHIHEADDVALYLSYVGGEPAGTAATIRSGSTATLEFVSTLERFRGMGAATAACAHALGQLAKEGVKLATLRAGHEAAGLYRKLGFQDCFETVVMKL